MATATQPMPSGVEREAKELENEIAVFRGQVADEQKTLARLRGEQARLVELIGLKKEKPSKAVEMAAEIAGSESVIGGLNVIIAPKQRRLDEVLTELRHQREAAQKAAEIGEVTGLHRDAEAIITRIASVLQSTVRSDLDAYIAVRQRLDRIVNRAQMGSFPIPAPSMAANEARKKLDKLLLEKLGPILKMLGR